MSKITKYLIGTCVIFIIALVAFIDYKHDYPEKFILHSFDDVHLMRIVGKNAGNCYIFSDSLNLSKTGSEDTFILAIRFKVKYISIHREHLWESNHKLYGGLGHLDLIKSFKLETSSKKVFDINLEDASSFKKFYLNDIASPSGHHGDLNGCYEAQTFTSLSTFISYYNSNAEKGHIVFGMNDYHFFKVKYETVEAIVKEKANFALNFNDGRKIEKKITYANN